jgi:hypothetical protein
VAGTITHVAESPVLFDLRIHGPINKDTKATELANLNGLTNSVTVDLGLGALIWNPRLDPVAADEACDAFLCDVKRADVVCFRNNLPAWRKRSDELADLESCSEMFKADQKTMRPGELDELKRCRKKYGNKPASELDLQLQLLSGTAEPGADCARQVGPANAADMSVEECRRFVATFHAPPGQNPEHKLEIQAFNRKFDYCDSTKLPRTSAYRARLLNALHKEPPPILIALRGAVGREDFTFVDKDTLKKSDESKTNFSLVGTAGALLEPIGLITATYRFERSHKAGRKTSLCTPIGTTGATTCNDVNLGAPTVNTHNQLQVGVRRFFGTQLAIDPRYTYDANEGISALEMPIYFLTNKDNGLTGGISVGWRSDTDQVTASIFVGAALTMFEGPWQNPLGGS